MKAILVLLALVGALLLAAVIWAAWRTYKTEHSANQEAFRQGTAAVTALDGEFRGHVDGYTGSWQGKTLRVSHGINRFQEQDGVVERYPFAIVVASGLRDRAQEVIRLDYNQPGNPWWLRFIIDEMVQVAPETYLGKVHVRPLPGVVFSLGYFTLIKN